MGKWRDSTEHLLTCLLKVSSIVVRTDWNVCAVSPRLHSDTVLDIPRDQRVMSLTDYKSELIVTAERSSSAVLQACETCISCNVGRPIKPYLNTIPVSGPFNRVGVDVKFSWNSSEKRYAVVFVQNGQRFLPYFSHYC